MSRKNTSKATEDNHVSVIVPLYNKQHTILDAIDSILSQSHQNFSIIIIDDGSTDKSGRIAKSIDDERVSYWYQENHGPGHARNTGVKKACSEFIAFLDADDVWLDRNYLACALDQLKANPNITAYVSGYAVGPNKVSLFDFHIKKGLRLGLFEPEPTLDCYKLKHLVDFFHTSCVVARRQVISKYGGFYERQRCTYGEDSWLWIHVLLNEMCYLDPRPSVWFRTQYSALGLANRGNHPTRPAITNSEELRKRIKSPQQPNLARLLALYRLIESLQLADKRPPQWQRRIHELTNRFPHPPPKPFRFWAEEIKIKHYTHMQILTFWRTR